jgi:hypothetical protein
MILDKLDLLILDSLCLDMQQKDIFEKLEIPKSTMTTIILVLKETFKVKTISGLIYKYSLLCSN